MRTFNHARGGHAGRLAHGTLVQCENGTVLAPIDRLAALAQAYDLPLAHLLVSHAALAAVVTMLERAGRVAKRTDPAVHTALSEFCPFEITGSER